MGEMGGEDMMDDRDSDAYMGGEERNQIEEYEKKILEAQKAAGVEDSAEEDPVEMKGRYNPASGGEGEAAVLNQAEDEEESPAAGSESHKYLGGFEDENDEEDME